MLNFVRLVFVPITKLLSLSIEVFSSAMLKGIGKTTCILSKLPYIHGMFSSLCSLNIKH